MAPDPSSQSHLPPAWPETPREDAPGWPGNHRDDLPGWPEPPRNDPAPGRPRPARDDVPPPWPAAPHGDPGRTPAHDRAHDHGGPPAWPLQAPRPPVPPVDDDGLGTVQGPLPPRPATSDANDERTAAMPVPPRTEGGPPPGHRQGPGPLPAPPPPPVPPAPAPPRHGRHSAQPGPPPGPGAPGGQPGPPPGAPRPQGGDLGRDPADPYRPFVTAGQISGPKTPPPQRQQELWNTVFGENYQEIGEEEDLDQQGGRVWIYALAGSAAVALIAATIWAFLVGPLAAEDGGAATAQPVVTKSAPPQTRQPIGRLPRFKGKASPVIGTLVDQEAAITMPRLGGPWRLDERPAVRTSYGYHTRQYVRAGADATGRTQYAQVMSGPLAKQLTSKYTSPDNLNPVISAVAYQARLKFFAKGNTIRKTAQQALTVDGMPGWLVAYEVTAGQTKTTMVVAAVITGADYPAIVYMSIPESRKQLLPDVNTVVKQMRLATP